MKHFPTIVFWVIMVGILIAMFVLASQDAAQTGEELSIVGVLAAWVGIVVLSGLIMKFRSLLAQGMNKLLDEANKRLDEPKK